MTFKFRYKVMGGHTWVRFFANGGKAGEFVLRNEGFEAFKRKIVVSPSGVATQQDVFQFVEEE